MVERKLFQSDEADTTGSGGAAAGGGEGAPTQIFAGCYFTISALAGTSEDVEASQIVLQNGGRCFTAETAASMVGCSTVYAVCPFSLPPARLHELRMQPDFRIGALGKGFEGLHN